MSTGQRKSWFQASIHVRKGNFHKLPGKKSDSAITAADIAMGKASDDPHVVKVATFAANFKKWQ